MLVLSSKGGTGPRRGLWTSVGRAASSLVLGAAMMVPITACEDDNFQGEWVANPGTIRLFSLARPELNLDSGFDFNGRQRVQIERVLTSPDWDVAVDTQDGELVFIPPSVLGIESTAGVASFPGTSFDDVTQAPDSTAFTFDGPVPIALNTVYVVQTGEELVFGFPCLFYAKLEPFEIDLEEQRVSFMFVVNPFCDDRNLVPESEG